MNTAENLLFAAAGAGDITTVNLNVDTLVLMWAENDWVTIANNGVTV